MTTRDKADSINRNLEQYLTQSGTNIRCNFRCLNPKHRDRIPSMHYYSKNNTVHCFGCGATYDLIDLIGIENGCANRKEAFKKACEVYDADSCFHVQKLNVVSKEKGEFDYTKYFRRMNRSLGNTEYHRGISLNTLNRFMVGYDYRWVHPKSTNNRSITPSPRLIIPTSRTSYIARDTRSNLTKQQDKYKKQKVGKIHIFNEKCLDRAKDPIFIVEGELDALSIIDCGFEAIGLGSTANVDIFIALIARKRPKQSFIIALDNDSSSAVEIAIGKLKQGFEKHALPYIIYSPYGNYKDANEALMSAKDAFITELEYASNMAINAHN